MSENTSTEIWQIDVNGQIYEAPFDEMAVWIAEGSLLRGDKVRKGSLRWIEAGRVPSLLNFFNAKESGNPVYPTVSTTVETPRDVVVQVPVENFSSNPVAPPAFTPPRSFDPQPAQNYSQPVTSPYQPEQNFTPRAPVVQSPAEGVCVMHTDVPAAYLCETCGSAMCKACPNSYGGTVKICPFCGAMCKSLEAVAQKQQETARFDEAMSEGFGFADFGRALAYPFKFKFSLIVGAIMFALFSYGQSASAMGGIMLIASSIFCYMGANMLTFGVLSNTVENFSQGKIGLNFMPQFDGFSLWEDLVHPFFMSVAVYIVSFGLFAALLIGSVLYFWNAVAKSATNLVQDNAVGTIMPGSQGDIKSAQQLPQVQQFKESLNKRNQWTNGEMPSQDQIVQRQNGAGVHDTEDDVMRAQQMIQQQQKTQAESLVGKHPDEQNAEFRQMAAGLIGKAALMIIPIALAFLWGLFYFPAACAVAGYTGSFTATLNPSVGFDTIKRLGGSYAMILLMSLLIVIMSVIIRLILGAIFSPFDIPKMGNIPANIIGSFISFYFAIVFSCILGFAIYKNSHKLKLFRT
jgi:Protein of unknown function (DUF4013)